MLERVRAARVFGGRYSLIRHCAQTAPAGIACEFGVRRGWSLQIIRNFRKPPVFGFDSFEGLPADWNTGGDPYPAGTFACEPPADLATGVELVRGWFADTIPAWKQANAGAVRLLHIDCDLYESAREALFGMNDRIEPGSVLLFDELVDFDETNYPRWREGEWRALNEWLVECSRTAEPIGRTGHQQAAFIVV